ncbi:hypothetical protein PRZ48_013166 [Zasmidium cellare]|uniref:Uncharacterized protein n=1 Tax=Zasmidium cellare TaxID=395010 RepID=A0ABR0E469_ZASCE|nr:hypothetical protein PRZ48_013166 [Zasmidium cellare]
MHFTQTSIVALLAVNALSLPVPQLADNGVGYGIENAEDNTAATITKAGVKLVRRQLAGEGAACDSILSETDNGVGYGIQHAEENTAKTISSAPKVPTARRQLDKISNGFASISNAAGTGALTGPTTNGLDGIDGTSTEGAAQLGAEVGSTEEGTLEAIGSAVPKRQLDKVSNGFQTLSDAAGTGALTSAATTGLDGVDGTSTEGAAQLGAEIGSTEEGTLEAVGSATP